MSGLMGYKDHMKEAFAVGDTELGITYFWIDMGDRILNNEFDWIRVRK